MIDVTGIVVCYNTTRLIEIAYNSIRKFYPNMPIIIVDASNVGTPCAAYVDGLKSDKTTVITPGRNVGHGRGMHLGITHAKTKYALIFDSDIEVVSDCVPAMLEKMEEHTFGIGHVLHVDIRGNATKRRPGKLAIPYLHPFFHLINIQNYMKYKPYVHNGAPCLSTMYDLYRRKLSGKVLINFPTLTDHIKHKGRGTREQYQLNRITDPWQVMTI
jgi:GT2 family glycosyltransferase